MKNTAIKNQEMYEEFMDTNPLLAEMNPYERLQIADAFKSVSFHANEDIVRESDWGDILLYYRRRGNCY